MKRTTESKIFWPVSFQSFFIFLWTKNLVFYTYYTVSINKSIKLKKFWVNLGKCSIFFSMFEIIFKKNDCFISFPTDFFNSKIHFNFDEICFFFSRKWNLILWLDRNMRVFWKNNRFILTLKQTKEKFVPSVQKKS